MTKFILEFVLVTVLVFCGLIGGTTKYTVFNVDVRWLPMKNVNKRVY